MNPARKVPRAPAFAVRTASLPHLLLSLVSDRPHSVGVLLQTVKAYGVYASGSAVLSTLRRLEGEGALDQTWEPGTHGHPQCTYGLTERGRRRLEALAAVMVTAQDP
jgi:DNA-binding PadR family transcriptional regulator